MSTHPLVPFDQGLIDDIAARMDLRTPNREALEAVAKRFDGSGGEPFEVVCDIATAVGKTYLAGGLIEYLAASGVRNFLIVTPGRTILNKTVANFTEGHPKSVLGGMEASPLVVTSENFNTGATGSALHDGAQVKLFVFTVQSLLKPDKATRRRTRDHQEWLGEALYQYFQSRDDLVVIADEHHVYSETAKSFSDAVRDIGAMALVGLTATPTKSDADKVVYQYPLARAIAERFVKTPVLVGRRDNASGVETQLRDALILLEAKQTAADRYAQATGRTRVNAVLFVVADTIDNANAVAEVLRKPGLFETDYEERVLVVHSDAAEDALVRLEAVEHPDSPVRVIVSVSMLKEGWDVRNIYVICSLRPSISDVLTEQTLGRGLRLPWGEYTGVELLDTVEVISHERYEKLLERAGVLLEGLVDARVVPKIESIPTSAVPDGSGDAVVVSSSGPDRATNEAASIGRPAGESGPELVVASFEERSSDAASQTAAMTQAVAPTRVLRFPRVARTVTARSFSLSKVPDEVFKEIGSKLTAAVSGTLERKVLEVVEDAAAATGYRLVPTDASEVIAASRPEIPFGNAVQALTEAICGFDVVESSASNLNAAKRLAHAVLDGAGGDEAILSPYLNAAINMARLEVNRAFRDAPEVVDERAEDVEFGPQRLNTRPVEQNRFGPFSPKLAYAGWRRSLYPLQWFDTSPERTLANLLDANEDVEVWTRIQRGELTIQWRDGQYSPDLYALAAGINYLLEVKRDRDMEQRDVLAKKAAAEDWARFVTDTGLHGRWRYLLVAEGVLETAKTFAAVIAHASG